MCRFLPEGSPILFTAQTPQGPLYLKMVCKNLLEGTELGDIIQTMGELKALLHKTDERFLLGNSNFLLSRINYDDLEETKSSFNFMIVNLPPELSMKDTENYFVENWFSLCEFIFKTSWY